MHGYKWSINCTRTQEKESAGGGHDQTSHARAYAPWPTASSAAKKQSVVDRLINASAGRRGESDFCAAVLHNLCTDQDLDLDQALDVPAEEARQHAKKARICMNSQRAFARDSTCKAPWGAAIAPPQIDQPPQQQQQRQRPPPDVVDLTVDDE